MVNCACVLRLLRPLQFGHVRNQEGLPVQPVLCVVHFAGYSCFRTWDCRAPNFCHVTPSLSLRLVEVIATLEVNQVKDFKRARVNGCLEVAEPVVQSNRLTYLYHRAPNPDHVDNRFDWVLVKFAALPVALCPSSFLLFGSLSHCCLPNGFLTLHRRRCEALPTEQRVLNEETELVVSW